MRFIFKIHRKLGRNGFIIFHTLLLYFILMLLGCRDCTSPVLNSCLIFNMLFLYFILMLLGCSDRTPLGMNSCIIFHILFLYFILMLLGCRDRAPLGMNSGYIAKSQLTSSATYNRRPNYHINYARLAIKLAEWRIKDINGGWIQVTSLHRDKFH